MLPHTRLEKNDVASVCLSVCLSGLEKLCILYIYIVNKSKDSCYRLRPWKYSIHWNDGARILNQIQQPPMLVQAQETFNEDRLIKAYLGIERVEKVEHQLHHQVVYC